MDAKQRPKVGIGVYVLNNRNQLLLLQEKRSDGSLTWAPPGGHLEFGEEFLDCVKREAKEEVNLDIIDADIWEVNNTITLPDFHYVNVDFLVKSFIGQPKIMEPAKCQKLDWFNINNLPSPLLAPVTKFFKNNPPCLCRSGKKFLDCHGKANA
ncbi:MAG: NUDIX hydrolase [Candidatus Paceibacterales bacterium]